MDISTAKREYIQSEKFRVKNSDMFMLRRRAPLCLSILSTCHQLAPTHVHTKELTDAASSILITVIIKKKPSFQNTVRGRGDMLHVDLQ